MIVICHMSEAETYHTLWCYFIMRRIYCAPPPFVYYIVRHIRGGEHGIFSCLLPQAVAMRVYGNSMLKGYRRTSQQLTRGDLHDTRVSLVLILFCVFWSS